MNQQPEAQLAPYQIREVEPVAELVISQEQMRGRLNEAREQSDFYIRGPETNRAFEDYYHDNYALAGVMTVACQEIPTGEAEIDAQRTLLEQTIDGSTITGETVQDDLSTLVDYGNTPLPFTKRIKPLLAAVRLARLDQPDNQLFEQAELRLLDQAAQTIFAEASLGVTTLNENEATLVTTLSSDIQARIKASDTFFEGDDGAVWAKQLPGSKMTKNENLYSTWQRENPLKKIQDAQERFWADTRFAGQLLFHNTTFFTDVQRRAAILPRRMQQKLNGTFNTINSGTLGDHLHSPTPHWSEDYDEVSYRGAQGADNVGTIAIPMWKMIEDAPYGRDAQYEILELKPARQTDIIPKVTINDGTTFIGPGSQDGQGRGGYDRTFYRSPNDVSPDTPLEEAPDGYKIKINEDATIVRLGREEATEARQFYVGEHAPQEFLIDVENPDAAHDAYAASRNEAEWRTARQKRKAEINSAIQELQHQSINSRPNEIVVPIRAGAVFDFFVQDDNYHNGSAHAEFNRVVA